MKFNKNKYLIKKSEGELIILDHDEKFLFVINEIGARIIALIEEENNLSKIKDRISEEYDVPKVELDDDINKFFGSMRELDLLS